MIKHILMDVSGTLLYKAEVYPRIQQTLQKNGYDISLEEIKNKHKTLSEVIFFPDRTSKDFYHNFNSEFLYSLGISPKEELLEAIFKTCYKLPWNSFEDTSVLDSIKLPVSILSNFNTDLRSFLKQHFTKEFNEIIVSEEENIAKPKLEFYQLAIDKLNCKPEEILYIGDSIKLDFTPAQTLGIKTLIVDRDNYYSDVLDYKIKSLKEILNFI